MIWRQIQKIAGTSILSSASVKYLFRHQQTQKLSKMPEIRDETSSPVAKEPRLEIQREAGPVMKFAKLTPEAFTPTRGSKQAAGFDLYRFVIRDQLRTQLYFKDYRS